MAIDKKEFLKKVIVIIDTREQENKHITDKLDELGIMHERRKLDYGDYSFIAEGRDFSMSCVVERKGTVDELYGNIMQDRGRIEKELYASSNLAKQFSLLIEGVDNWEDFKSFQVPDRQMKNFNRKVQKIGQHCYNTIQAWRTGNRYDFYVEFVKEKQQTATKILELFYYYWRSYKEMTGARK